ncbi:MAG: hypothetical protein KGD60_13780 [Candidatus Thorarchaeota archaeon]|nr:hypothetical protein [Candidatus Thorarchaeota archaeon]
MLKLLVVPIFCMLIVFVFIDSATVFPWEKPPQPEHSFTWAVSVDDEFIFNTTSSGLGITENTMMRVLITSLPNDTINSETDFLDLISKPKVHVNLDNGSVLPSDLRTSLESFISRLFLPIGGWEYLDAIFPDNATEAGQHEFGCNTYLAILGENNLFFGHRYYNVDNGNGWHGVISLTTGVPLVIETWASDYVPPYVSYHWTFRLDLIGN